MRSSRWGLPGAVVAADTLGRVGEALQGDAAAQLQAFPPMQQGQVRGVAWSSHTSPLGPNQAVRPRFGYEARRGLPPILFSACSRTAGHTARPQAPPREPSVPEACAGPPPTVRRAAEAREF